MSTKTKTQPNLLEKAHESAASAGIVLMALAITAGLIEAPHDQDKKAILPVRPVFAFAGSHQQGSDNDPALRRERDDLAPHYVSYSTYQRTPSRSGRH